MFIGDLMAEYIPSQINFSKLLSHTFPGIFMVLGIFMLFYLCVNGESVVKIQFFEDWKVMLVTFAGIIFFGTIVGIIIDSLSHKIQERIMKSKPYEKIKQKENDLYKDLENKPVSFVYFIGFLPLERLNFLNDDWYCYIEFELNMFISSFCSAFIYSYFIFKIGLDLWIVAIVFIILIIFSFYNLYSGKSNFLRYMDYQVDFVKGALEGKYKIKSFQPK